MKKFLLLLPLFLPLVARAQMFGYDPIPTDRPATHECVYKDTLVAAADGSLLVTQLFLPKGEGPWPVVVYRTPYYNFPTGDWLRGFKQYAEHGIGFLVQRCRGTGGSEGRYEPNIYEREDGLALLQWLQEASWCKSIGLTGCSYMGLTSWIVADALPSKVKGIYLEHYGVDRHLSAYSSGLFRQDILTGWAIDNAKESIRKPEVAHKDEPYYSEMRYMPQLTMDEDLLGAPLPWYRDWISHTDYTDPYWHTGFWALLRSIPPKIQVPVTVVAGHFDHHMEGTLLGYQLLPTETKAKSRLIVGGWNHFFVTTPELPGITHDKEFNVDLDTFEWMYSLLVEEKEPVHEVRVYDIGADKWLNLKDWPSSDTVSAALYLQEDGGISREAGHSKPLLYTYDPQNPVMSVGGETLFNSSARRGSVLQPPVGYRDDILFFRSEPLAIAQTISGSMNAVIHFRSDCEDTAVAVKISEERADGSTYNIRTGIATLAFREDKLGPRGTYKPGVWVDVKIEMLPIVWELQKGSRIRVDVTSSDFPQYSIHSNYSGGWAGQTQTRVAHQEVMAGASRIEIPFMSPTPEQIQAYLASLKPDPEHHVLTPDKKAMKQSPYKGHANYGKSIAVFGGSLSVNPESDAAKQQWANLLGATVTTYGVGGAGFAREQGCTLQRQVDEAGVYDIYVLWASTNDYMNNRPCGSWKDYTVYDGYDESKRSTQCGGINYCIKKLREKNPEARIYFFTSLRFFGKDAGHNPFSTEPNETGQTFAQYIEAQKACCQYHGVPVLDQFSIQDVDEHNYQLYYLQDRLHMNEAGYKRLGPVQAAFLAN